MRIRQALAAAAVLAVTTASLAACGNDADDSSDTPALSRANATAPSEEHLDKDGLVRAITEGPLRAGSAHMRLTMSGALAMKAVGDISYRGATSQMKMTVSMAQLGDRRMEMRLVDGLVYLSVPRMTPAGKFARIDPSEGDNPMSKGFGSLSRQLDPLNSVRAMKAGVQKVRFVGEESIEGVDTDHYVVTVASAPMLKAMKQKDVPGVPDTLTYDMWLDGKDLLRRMRFELSGLRTEVVASKWGEPVTVQAPPATDVVVPNRAAS